MKTLTKFIVLYVICALLINCCLSFIIDPKNDFTKIVNADSTTNNVTAKLETSIEDMSIQVKTNGSFTLSVSGNSDKAFTVTFVLDHNGSIAAIPPYTFEPGVTETVITVVGVNPGQTVISTYSSDSSIDTSSAYVTVTTVHTLTLITVSNVVGWIYFIAWSISFYPQIFINWRRKSVIGLNFDFVYLNLTGFLLYSLYNCGLFWSPLIQNEYFKLYPHSVIPVQINDVVFSLHALFATIITVIQCFIYERGNQRVSIPATILLGLIGLTILVSIILVVVAVTTWFEFLNICSYIKLTITLVKYIPQAVMNFRRKSTLGWSIGNVLLDFTGGAFSMLQMFILAYNNDDWSQLFGDFTKFALGLISILFDIIFMIQHYILYRNAFPVPEDTKRLEESESSISTAENSHNKGDDVTVVIVQ